MHSQGQFRRNPQKHMFEIIFLPKKAALGGVGALLSPLSSDVHLGHLTVKFNHHRIYSFESFDPMINFKLLSNLL